MFTTVAWKASSNYAKAPFRTPMTLRGLADGIVLGFSGRARMLQSGFVLRLRVSAFRLRI